MCKAKLDVWTCVLPLGTVGRGRASEVDAAHLFLTIIQLYSARHLISQHTSTCIHNIFISHAPSYLQKSCGDWRVEKQQVLDTLGAVVADLHAGGSVVFCEEKQ